MLEGPIPATREALARANLTIDDIDLVEVNEAFSSIPLAWAAAMTGGDLTKVHAVPIRTVKWDCLWRRLRVCFRSLQHCCASSESLAAFMGGQVNVNGGAIARGHPMGATGGMLMANLIGELERRGKRYGLLTMCESGGTANATIVERVDAPLLAPPPVPPLTPPTALPPPVPPAASLGRPAPTAPGSRCVMTMGAALRAVAAWKGELPAVTALAPGEAAHHMSFRELEGMQAGLKTSRTYQTHTTERIVI